jgi:hypothetical protein
MDNPFVYLLIMSSAIAILYFFAFDGDSDWFE